MQQTLTAGATRLTPVPGSRAPVEPTSTLPSEPDVAALRADARRVYRNSVESGQPLSGRRLGAMFDRSGRWGRDRIAEVRAEDARQSPDAEQPTGQADPNLVAATRQPSRGRAIAWVAFVSGIVASVAANVMHAQLVTGSPAAWIGAAFWPVALMLAVEVLARVTWPRGSRWYGLARYGGTTLVALVAAVISYRHMSGVLAAWGEDSTNSHLGPLAVDGLMVVAAAALMATSRTPRGAEV